MNEDDVVVKTSCCYMNPKQDCDGDYQTHCEYTEFCPYKTTVNDCDGDPVVLCAIG